jgi:GT2 family glycosyltransferase
MFSTSDYLILLNSDTIVSQGWDEAMIGLLQNRTDVGITGFQGGVLDEDSFGCGIAFGEEIDYVAGWCMCLHKTVRKKVGLFDNNLQFAYGEDSDLCLRIKENGYKLYALHLGYVKHFGGATIKQVKEKQDVTGTFKSNHLYLKNKWNNYLKHDRVLARKS